ncbi:MAG: hypothetical protein OEO79_14690 [Gemmatimonadota bacterium]|nr:hypothetical protein [Gemmatimonadota bacterium]
MMGIRSIWAHAVLTLFAAVAACDVSAQATVFAGGAATVPVSDFGTIADLGYLGFLGGTVEVGSAGLAVGAAGFFGSNQHKIAGERSDLYGMTVMVGYTVAEAYEVRFRTWGGLGGMVHARRSDTFPGLDASKRGLSVSVGAEASRAAGRVRVFASGLYTHGLGALGTSSYPTDIITLNGGVAVPLGID